MLAKSAFLAFMATAGNACEGDKKRMYEIIVCNSDLQACAKQCGGEGHDSSTCQANTKWCYDNVKNWKENFGDCADLSCDSLGSGGSSGGDEGGVTETATTTITEPPPTWTEAVLLNNNAREVVTDIGEADFNEKFAACPVVRYMRNSKVHAVYVRSSMKIPPSFNAYKIFTDTWRNDGNNLNRDFKLYDSVDDARADRGAWTFCNYNDPDVAFPRDCGKHGGVGNIWFSMPGGRFYARGIHSGVGFEIYTGSDCPAAS